MSGVAWGCLSTSQVVVGLLTALLCLGLAAAFGARARHHFLAGRNWWGFGMVAGAVASGASATLWVICTFLGAPPFFMGEILMPPCDGAKPERTEQTRAPVHSPCISVMTRRRAAASSPSDPILSPSRALLTVRIWSTATSAGRPPHRTCNRERQAGCTVSSTGTPSPSATRGSGRPGRRSPLDESSPSRRPGSNRERSNGCRSA